MAGKVKKINLEVELTAKGIKKATKELNELNTAQNKVSKSANALKRANEGVAQRANRSGKDFSRMSQGMGGLVKAYATVAANVYALSSAFKVLERSADLSSMIISAENLASVTGRNFQFIAKNMQQASGAALSFGESLALANKAGTTPASNQQIVELTQLATKAAQTFGGTTTDAMNRFVDATLRGRTELVQKLGIVVNLDKAMSTYAATLNKSGKELNEFERQQAIINAIIKQGNAALGDITIDPNPYQTLAKAFTDLSDEILKVARDILHLDDIAIFFRDNTEALAGAVGLIAASIVRTMVPSIAEMTSAFAQKAAPAIQATTNNLEKYRGKLESIALAQERVRKAVSKHGQERIRGLEDAPEGSKKGALRRVQSALGQSQFDAKKHQKDLENINRQMQRLIQSESDVTKGVRGIEKAFIDWFNTDKAGFAAVAADVKRVTEILRGVQTQTEANITGMRRFGEAAKLALLDTSTGFKLAGSLGTSMFSSVLAAAQNGIGPMSKLKEAVIEFRNKWAEGVKQVSTPSKIVGGLSRIGLAMGGLGAITTVAFSSILSVATTIFFAYSVLKPLIIGVIDSIRGLDAEEKKLIKSTEEYTERLEESEKPIKNLIKLQERFKEAGVSAAQRISQELKFVTNALQDYVDSFTKQIDEVSNRVKQLGKLRQQLLQQESSNIGGAAEGISGLDFIDNQYYRNLEDAGSIAATNFALGFREIANAETLLDQAGFSGDSFRNQFVDKLNATGVGQDVIDQLTEQLDKIKAFGYSDVIKNDIEEIISSAGLGVHAILQMSEAWTSVARATNASTKSADQAISTVIKVSDDFSARLNQINQKGILDPAIYAMSSDLEKALKTITTEINNSTGQINFKHLRTALQQIPKEFLPKMIEDIGDYAGLMSGSMSDLIESLRPEDLLKLADSLGINLRKNIDILSKSAKRIEIFKATQDLNKAIIQENKLRSETNITIREAGNLAKNSSQLEISNLQLQALQLEEQAAQKRTLSSLDEEQATLANLQATALERQANTLREQAKLINPILEAMKAEHKAIEKIDAEYKSVLDKQSGFVSLIEDGLDSLTLSLFKERELIKLKKEQEQLELRALQRKIAQARLEVQNTGDPSGKKAEELKYLEDQENYLKEQINLRDKLSQISDISLNHEEKRLKLLKEQTDLMSELNNIRSSTSFSSIDRELLALQNIHLSLQQQILASRDLAVEREKLSNKEARIKTLMEKNNLSSEEARDLIEQENKSLNIKAQIIDATIKQLKQEKWLREKLIEATSLQNEQLLGGLASKKGMKNAADLFIFYFAEGADKLDPAMKTLAEGFSNTLNSSIENVVDSLMEHGFSKMGRALKQSLVEGLTEALNDVFTNNIKKLVGKGIAGLSTEISGVFGLQTDKDIGKETPELLLNTTLGNTNTNITTTNTTLLATNNLLTTLNTTMSTIGRGQETRTSEISAMGTQAGQAPKTTQTASGIEAYNVPQSQEETAANTEEINTGITSLNTTVATGLAAGVAAYYASGKDTKTAIVTAIFTMTAQLVSAMVASNAASMFADGGIAKGGFRAFADGGLVKKPTIGLVGEGKKNEAIVPLPNNRAIPVDLRSNAGGDIINVSQSFDFRNADENAIGKLRAEARNIEDRTFNKIFNEINKGGKYARMVGRK